MLNVDHIKRMLNKGHLTIETAIFLYHQGYSIICRNGQVISIIKDEA